MSSPRKINHALMGQQQEATADNTELMRLQADLDTVRQKLGITIHDIFTEMLTDKPHFTTIHLPENKSFKVDNHDMIRAVRDSLFEKIVSGELKAGEIDRGVHDSVGDYFEGKIPGFSALDNNNKSSIIAKHSAVGLAHTDARHPTKVGSGNALDAPYAAAFKKLAAIKDHLHEGNILVNNLTKACERLHPLWASQQYSLFCDRFNDIYDNELNLVKKYMKKRKGEQLFTLPTVSEVTQSGVLNTAKLVLIYKNIHESLSKNLALQTAAYEESKEHLKRAQKAVQDNLTTQEEKTPSSTHSSSSSVLNKSVVSRTPQCLFNHQQPMPINPAPLGKSKPTSCCLII